MELTLNNRPETIVGDTDPVTIQDILTIKNFTFPRIVVKLNGKLIRKPEYDATIVQPGDNLEVIHLISGG